MLSMDRQALHKATKSPPSAFRGGQALMRSIWLPSGHIPLREPPCPERQVGEGDALLLMLIIV